MNNPKNNPKNIVEDESKPNELKLTTALDNVDSEKILGLEKHLAFIMFRGDQDEAFSLMDLIKPNCKSFILLPKSFS